MRRPFSLILQISLLAVPLPGQNVNPNYPVEIQAQKHATPEDMRARVSNVQLQKDARELAELCASVPADMDALKQGLLSKDALEKLKRVEKLSKRVREELARISTAP
jgi:hypothetical protein